jgi:hypothetical protein
LIQVLSDEDDKEELRKKVLENGGKDLDEG